MLCNTKTSQEYYNDSLKPIIDSSLLLWVTSDFGTSVTWNDLSTNNIIGTNVGGVRTITHPSGIFGYHYNFNGTNAYINLGNAVIGNSTSFTISVWYKTTDNTRTGSTSPVIYGEGNTTNNNPIFNIALNDPSFGDIKFGIRDNGGKIGTVLASGHSSNDGLWHNLVGVQESKSSRLLYMDGVLIGTNTVALGTITVDNSKIGMIKMIQSVRFYYGDIGSVVLYNRGITSAEVMYNYIHSPFYYIKTNI